MNFIKFFNHIKAFVKYIFFLCLYKKKCHIGKNTTWRRNFSIMIDHNGKLIIGDNCFFNNDCTIDVTKYVEIGAGTIFGENVKIYDHNHKFNDFNKMIKEQGYSEEEVYIGKNCWIGSNVTILKGTHIGNNCVIGAGCTVTGNIEKETILKCNSSFYLKEKIINNKRGRYD